MKKLLTIFILIALYSIDTNAQSGAKITVGIIPFSSNAVDKTTAAMIYEAFSSAFTESKRFNVVDRNRWDVLQKERELQKSEEFLDGQIAEQGRSVGAEYIVTGNVGTINTTRYTNKNSSTGATYYTYGTVISIAYKIVNVSTSEILYSGSFSAGHTGGFFNPSAGTQENALSLAIQDVRKKAGMDIKKAFPIKVKIIKVLEEDDEKVKKVLINAGASSGLTGQKDVRVVYYENIDVDGKILSRTVDVTTGEITSVVDENFSELTIRKTEKGGQKVKEKIKEGKQLYIISSK